MTFAISLCGLMLSAFLCCKLRFSPSFSPAKQTKAGHAGDTDKLQRAKHAAGVRAFQQANTEVLKLASE